MIRHNPAIDGALVRRNLMISDRQHEELRRIAYEERISMSELVRQAIEAYLSRRAT